MFLILLSVYHVSSSELYAPTIVTMSCTFCGWGGWPCIYDLAVRKLDQIEMSRKLGIDTGIERPHEHVHTCNIYIYTYV